MLISQYFSFGYFHKKGEFLMCNSVILFITISIMIIIIIHLQENETLSSRTKRKLKFVARVIAICATCEFLGNLLNEEVKYRYLHSCIKVVELIVAPTIPFAIAKIVSTDKSEKMLKIFSILILGMNSICEVISIFIPFVFYIDNENIYYHKACYVIYVSTIVIGIIIVVMMLVTYSKKYQCRNIATILASLIFLAMSICIRKIDNSVDVDWLVVSIIYLVFIIYYSDLSLKVDALTSLLDRKSYEHRLEELYYKTAIILIDANSFKKINDNYGHQCGDTILKVIAKSILKVYGKYGFCYRIGGDEFCIILKPAQLGKLFKNNKTLDINSILEKFGSNLKKLLEEAKAEYPMLENGVSIGWALYDPYNNDKMYLVQDAVRRADENMYNDKKQYKKEER